MQERDSGGVKQKLFILPKTVTLSSLKLTVNSKQPVSLALRVCPKLNEAKTIPQDQVCFLLWPSPAHGTERKTLWFPFLTSLPLLGSIPTPVALRG